MIRLLLYLGVVVVLFLKRHDLPWREHLNPLRSRQDDATLVVAGRAVAPALVDRLLARYQRDWPRLAVTVHGGGTNQALEDLINRRADAAFLLRPPTSAEQALFRGADGDTAVVVPVAVGALLVLAGADAAADTAGVAWLRARLSGAADPDDGVLYVPDPNEGTWAAACAAVGVAPEPLPAATARVVFLADATAVVQAVAAAPGARGVVSSLDAPVSADPDGEPAGAAGVKILRLGRPGEPAAAPTYEQLAAGAYPLHHYLYAACRPGGGIEGGKFITHLASARGLRQVEGAGAVPAKQVLREIYLTRDPVGR